jgi:hypothetical protein
MNSITFSYFMDSPRKVVTNPLIVEKVWQLGVTFLFIKVVVFGIANSAERSLREELTIDRSIEHSELRSRWEAWLSNETLSNTFWQGGKVKHLPNSTAQKHRMRTGVENVDL